MRYIYLFALLLITAQTEEKFRIRMTPVPLDGAMSSTVAGSGSGAATLSGNKLTINATFDGMPSAATAARLHKGITTGVRGSAFQDLTVSKAAKGAVSGAVELTPDQLDSLKKGKLCPQFVAVGEQIGGERL